MWLTAAQRCPSWTVFICHHHGNCHFLFKSWKTSEIPYIIFSKASFHFLYKQPLVSFILGKLVQLISSKLQLAVLWPDNSVPHFPQLLFNCITLKSANIFAQWIQWTAKFDKCCQRCLLQKGIRLTSLIQSCCQLMIQGWGMDVCPGTIKPDENKGLNSRKVRWRGRRCYLPG